MARKGGALQKMSVFAVAAAIMRKEMRMHDGRKRATRDQAERLRIF